jgi:uncharacterized membrane protein
MDGRNLSAEAKAEEKKLKERNFLRQFNTNFGQYKDTVNKFFYKRDKEETERLNQIQQPKYIYNNFPLILGALFLIFGIFLIMSEFSSDKNKQQIGSGIPTIINTQPSQPLIKYIPIVMPEKPKPYISPGVKKTKKTKKTKSYSKD